MNVMMVFIKYLMRSTSNASIREVLRIQELFVRLELSYLDKMFCSTKCIPEV